ncbi:hypothetical protein HMPREF1981_00561 [Bacteroides pyogenes F0041]|uniref:Uncharacterized protein n=1 Tax=Bacteroides pyogenes F0041 TaxID=1321819 RepID=U2CUY0_9BACE|nr:hypothetical protein HMPREF1981_00561 [Bacteroides pyogenes F0041]
MAGICAGKILIRLLLATALAIAVYPLTYALIIGRILSNNHPRGVSGVKMVGKSADRYFLS